MIELIERLMGQRRVTVQENQRVILLEKGKFKDILGAGEHRIEVRDTRVDIHDLNTPWFTSDLRDALFRARPDLAEQHLLDIVAGKDEVIVVLRDGQFSRLMRPENRVTVWKDTGPWELQRIDISETLDIEPALANRLARARITESVSSFEVADGSVGLLTVDNRFDRLLEAGVHRFWNVGRKLAVRVVDTRWRAHEVTGQEILTADRVTLRVNLSADFRVTDPVKAANAVKDFEEALHRALQFAFRKTLGARKLDQLLSEKVSVDAEAADQVRTEMAEIGLEVGAISLKDVILPGEMRDILNAVVQAEKEAEANVIRRREETNATRSLLNTAKVMAENPVMLRLKELEALESIAGKVERLTVHNGTEGLMTDLVKLRD
ncbi:slipin family protein [Halovulum sp. GXIMD14793]